MVTARRNRSAHLRRGGGWAFDIVNMLLLTLLAGVTLYPFVYIISVSISSVNAVLRSEVWLWPVGFSLESYQLVFRGEELVTSYMNTLWYTGVGTALNVVVTVMAAYPLSRQNYTMRGPLMVFFAITMFFSGGLVPTYILVNQLGLYDSRWAIVLPGILSVWNLVIARVFFQSNLPQEMTEAARIDGAGETMIFLKIALPLSKAIVAILVLYYAVGHWNNFFGPLIYLKSPGKYPMSLYLRKVLMTGVKLEAEATPDMYTDTIKNRALLEQLKHAVIVVTMLPIITVYPFLQKYFVKGVMVGALKG
ncbi:MAG: carbohydrate ABC transporter permease [Clostridiales bacterium]|nr:carbohydrate ABC transporter permease [Clostridiales bacterium]